MSDLKQTVQLDTIVIGGGQAGLATGYHLARRGVRFEILDAHSRVGDAWRNRWDSLRLFTPSAFVGLPGLPYRNGHNHFPTKDSMANYLESYARRFRLPVRNNTKVDKLSRHGERFLIQAGGRNFEASTAVVAMANYQVPKRPAFAQELDPQITQIHSFDYKNPSQLQDGAVLVVGVGNSGADIALEVAKTRKTWISGKESGHVPFPIDGFLGRAVLFRIVRFIGHNVLSLSTPVGRRLRPKLLTQTTPLVRVKPRDLDNAGIERVPKVVGVRGGKPLLTDGRTLDVSNVIWCTGFESGFSWIDIPVFDHQGQPMQDRGVAKEVPGLYFVGLHYQYAMSSATLIGVGRDAERVANAIAMRKHRAQAA